MSKEQIDLVFLLVAAILAVVTILVTVQTERAKP